MNGYCQDRRESSSLTFISKLPIVHSKLPHIKETIFTTMSRIAAEAGAINLSQGFPGFAPDPRLTDLIAHFTQNGNNQYAPMMGILELREALVQKTLNCYGVATDAEKEWTIVSGATQAIFSAVTAVVSPGDEVIVLEPAFDSYDPAILLNGAVPIHVPLDERDFSPDWNKIEAAITAKTKLIIVNTPHNPSGYVWTQSDMDQLARLVDKFGLYVVSDEVYEHILFDGREHLSLLLHPVLRSRTFVCGSFGKTFHITGWKIGYCVAVPELTIEFRKIHQYVTFTTVRPAQHALAVYLQEESTYLGLSEFYQRKRDLFLEGLSKTQFEFEPTQGSFFQQVRYGHLSEMGDKELAILLTQKLKVACIPVSSFYADGRDHKILRFCFAKEEEELIEATRRLERISDLFG
ncbi:methionine aminotransferase [Algoriphagus namhaensis]